MHPIVPEVRRQRIPKHLQQWQNEKLISRIWSCFWNMRNQRVHVVQLPAAQSAHLGLGSRSKQTEFI